MSTPPFKPTNASLDAQTLQTAGSAVPAIRCLVFCVVLVGTLLSVLAVPGDLRAQPFEIPEGFSLEAAPPGLEETDAWRTTVIVRPVDGAFSDLSTLKLRDVRGQVEDPDTWLQERLTADLGDPSSAKAFFDSPDSPFGDPSFDGLRDTIPELFANLQSLARKPLEFCDGPNTAYNASGPLHELYCVYQFGPFRQYIVLRLQQVSESWYYTEVRAMNERRLRHLIAIANSFRAHR